LAGTVPSKLLLQLKTVLQKGGLRNRNGTFFYKDHLRKSKVPVLAIAGDKDLICPPEAVYGIKTELANPLNAQLPPFLYKTKIVSFL
jgi:pimeloyl-ACP methyl ester carboxylesterase